MLLSVSVWDGYNTPRPLLYFGLNSEIFFVFLSVAHTLNVCTVRSGSKGGSVHCFGALLRSASHSIV